MGFLWNFLLTFCLLGLVSANHQLALGSPDECKEAKFVPGYNLGGEGFDIVKMERKRSYVIDVKRWDLGNGSCHLVDNDHLNGVKQKVPTALVFWKPLPKNSVKFQSMLYDSSESFMEDSTSAVSNYWKIGLNMPISGSLLLGGTQSREATYVMSKSIQDRYSFSKQEVQWSLYNYRIVASPPLHSEFLHVINSLNETTDLSVYEEIIDMFGTHYTSGVELGGKRKAVTALKTCEESLQGLTTTVIEDCLSREVQATYKINVKTELENCQALKNKLGIAERFSSRFSDRENEIIGGNHKNEDILSAKTNDIAEWIESLKSIPDVVSYTLRPLHLLLKETHPAREGLKTAIEEYITDNALIKVCSKSCSLGNQAIVRDSCNCVCERNRNILANCCPAERGLATLKVFDLHANDLYGDAWSKTDGSVEIRYDGHLGRTAVIDGNDNPRWPETFDFPSIQMSTILLLTVYDADASSSEVLGHCISDLISGSWTKICTLTHGTFYFSYTATCAPGLQGPKCSDHKPSRMDPDLAKLFRSRNGILFKDLQKLRQVKIYSEIYMEA